MYVSFIQASARRILLLALLLLAPSFSFAQITCEHDGDCASRQTCAFSVGARFGLAPGDNVCVAPGSLAPPTYEVVEFQPVTTNEGTFDRFIASQLNNRGQVVGSATRSEGTPVGEVVSAAFRFTPGFGVEILHPPGGESSAGRAITEEGDVIGEIYNQRREGFFLFEQGGFARLDQGANRALVRTFVLVDSNERGDLLGFILRRDRRLATYWYTEAEGWVNLAARFPSLREFSVLPQAINNMGDVLVTMIDPMAQPRGFLVQGGTRLVELNQKGSPLLPAAINDAGHIVGSAVVDQRRHAFVQDGAGNAVDLHRERFDFSDATAVTSSGIVVGGLAKGAPNQGGFRNKDTLFTFDQRRPQALKVVARRAEFRPLVPEDRQLGSVVVSHVNDRLEMVGTAHGFRRIEDENGVRIEFDVLGSFFYFSPAVGVVALGELLGDAGPEGNIPHVSGLNNRGQILVEFFEPTENENSFRVVGSALLTPMDN